MGEGIDVRLPVPAIPMSDVVVREQALVAFTDSAADVRTETVIPWITRSTAEPPEPRTACEAARTFTLSGRHRTARNGVVDLHLNKFLDCVPAVIPGTVYGNYLGSVPYFTATAESDGPIFITYEIGSQNVAPPPQQVFSPQALDVMVRVRSWRHDGTPAADVSFSWIAIARAASVTNF